MAVDMVEDLADEVWIGNIRYDPQLPAAKGDVYLEHALKALRPGQRCGGRIDAVDARFYRVLLPSWRNMSGIIGLSPLPPDRCCRHDRAAQRPLSPADPGSGAPD